MKCDKVPCVSRAFFPTCHSCHAMTFASLRLFTCLVYVSTYCAPIAHLRQNKPFPLLYLGHAQIIMIYSFTRYFSSFLMSFTSSLVIFRACLASIWTFISCICSKSSKGWCCWNWPVSLCIFMGFSSFCNKRFNTI